MAADWGAFAGGLTKGYLAGEEMRNTEKRTALMADEVEMRKKEAARREEEAAFQKRRRDAEEAYRTDYAAILPTLPYARDADGNIDYDPTNPANAKANTMAYGHSYRLRVQHKLTNPKEDADFLTMQQELAGKERAQAAQQFILTGDSSHLEKFDPMFKGAKIVVDKGPKDESFEFMQLADGTKYPMDRVYAAIPGGDKVLQARNVTADNARQDKLVDAQIKNMERDDSRRAAEFKENQTNGRVQDILAVKRYIKEGVVQKPEKDPLTGKLTEADPVWNDTAEAMLADRMKKYGTKKEDVAKAANDADDVQAEIRSSLREVDAQAKKDIADAKKAGKKFSPEKELEIRRQYFENFRKNGFAIPKREAAPQAAAPTAATARGSALPVTKGNRTYTRGGSYTTEPGSEF
jgi:hypothetical protein